MQVDKLAVFDDNFRYLKAVPIAPLKTSAAVVVNPVDNENVDVCFSGGDSIVTGAQGRYYVKNLCHCRVCDATLEEAKTLFFESIPLGIERMFNFAEGGDPFVDGGCWMRFFTRASWSDIMRFAPPAVVSMDHIALLTNLYDLSDEALTCVRLLDRFHFRDALPGERSATASEWLDAYVNNSVFFSMLGRTFYCGAFPNLVRSGAYDQIFDVDNDVDHQLVIESRAVLESDYYSDLVHARASALEKCLNESFVADVNVLRACMIGNGVLDETQVRVRRLAYRRIYNVSPDDVDDDELDAVIFPIPTGPAARVMTQIVPAVVYTDSLWLDEVDDEEDRDNASHSSRDPAVAINVVNEVGDDLRMGYCYLSCFADNVQDSIRHTHAGVLTQDQMITLFHQHAEIDFYGGWISITAVGNMAHIERVGRNVVGAVHVKTFAAELDGRMGRDAMLKYDGMQFGMPYTGWNRNLTLLNSGGWYDAGELATAIRTVSEVNFSLQASRDVARGVLNQLAEKTVVGRNLRFGTGVGGEERLFISRLNTNFLEFWNRLYSALDWKETTDVDNRRDVNRPGPADSGAVRPFTSFQDANRGFRGAVSSLQELYSKNPDIFFDRESFEATHSLRWVAANVFGELQEVNAYLNVVPRLALTIGTSTARAGSAAYPGNVNVVAISTPVARQVDLTDLDVFYMWSSGRVGNNRLRITFSITTSRPIAYEFIETLN